MIESGKGYECEKFFKESGEIIDVIHRGGLVLWPKDLTSREKEIIIDCIFRRYHKEYLEKNYLI